MLIWVVVSVFISLFFVIVSLFFTLEEESVFSNYSFECGLDTISPNRLPFCVHFFFISVLFLVFDIELVVTIPLVWMSSSWFSWFFLLSVVFVILFVGIMLEVSLGSLDWDLEFFKKFL